MRLKELRKRAKLTQEGLARILNVSRSAVAMWENKWIEPGNETLIQLAALFDVSIEYLLDAPDAFNKSTGILVPVVGAVAAGIPIEAIEEVVDWEETPETLARTGEFFGLRIKGQSMEPRIMEGDTVIVRRQEDVNSGDIAIVMVNGEDATCKKIVKHDSGGLTLISLNQTYTPAYYTPDEILALPIYIIGKVVELRGKF